MKIDRQGLSGILIGTSAGLFISSCVFSGAYVLAVFLSPALVALPVIGGYFGYRYLPKILSLKMRPATLLLWSGLGPLLALGVPYAAVLAELHWRGSAIPQLEQATIIETKANPAGSATTGPYIMQTSQSRGTLESVLAAYRATLERDGWRPVTLNDGFIWYTRAGHQIMTRFNALNQGVQIETRYHTGVIAPGLMLVLFVVSAPVLYRRVKSTG